jgi:hypothetical protein
MNGYRISVKGPCHENWTEMDLAEKGRFCQACSKVVADLTALTDAEVLRTIQAGGGGFCGRIQGVRTGRIRPLQSASFLSRFAFALLLAFGSFLFTLDAQAGTFFRAWKTGIKGDSTVDTTHDTLLVEGTVSDKENAEGIPFAAVTVLFEGKIVERTITDIDGKFRVKLPRATYSKVDVEVVSAGYEKMLVKDVLIGKAKKKVVEVKMKLNLCHSDTMGLIVIEYVGLGQFDNEPSGRTIPMNDYRSMPK